MSLGPAHVRVLMHDQYGRTALMWAAEVPSSECLVALLAADGIDVNVQSKVRHSINNHTCQASAHCAHARPASCHGHGGGLDGVSLVPAHVRALNCDQYDGDTALMCAASTGFRYGVTALLAVDGIDVNVQNKVRHGVDGHTCQASAHCVHATCWSFSGHAVGVGCKVC